jgi:hypothetical protein
MARIAGTALTEKDDESYRKTRFLTILFYVLALMAAMGVLAFLTVWLLRR